MFNCFDCFKAYYIFVITVSKQVVRYRLEKFNQKLKKSYKFLSNISESYNLKHFSKFFALLSKL